MSVLERFRRDRRVPANASFRLTQSGNEKLQEFRGDDRSRVLVALETEGTSTVSEIATNSGLSKGRVEKIIPSLIRGGFVQYISGASSGLSIDEG